MELHAPTAGTPVLQHRPWFSSFKFTPQYRCSSCNIDGTSCSHCGHPRLATQTRVLIQSSHRNIGAHLATQIELHAPTASISVLQHRWNFTFSLRITSIW